MNVKISVIIPSYNSHKHIKNTLQAITEQNTDINYEVILVDCSDDNRVRKIANLFDNIRYIYREERFNPGEGRNVGANQALGELLIFVDSDLTLDREALQQAWKAYQQGCQIFGGAIVLNEINNPTMASYLEHFYFNHESQKLQPRTIRKNLSSALMIINKELFLKEGGFNDIPRMQDTEFTERLKQNGHELLFIPEVIGCQEQSASLKNVLKKIYITGNNVYVLRYSKNMFFLKKLLFIFILPALSLFKIIRIVFRHLKYQDSRGRIITLCLIPLLLLSGVYWMLGFYNSLLFESGIRNDR